MTHEKQHSDGLYYIALPIQLVRVLRQLRKAANVNTACPGLRDLKLQRWLPAAFPQAIAADSGIGLCPASQWTDRAHKSSSAAVVVARTEDLEHELAWRIGRNHYVD